MMFLGAVSVFLLPGGERYRGIGTIRGPWLLVVSGLDIAIGVGLLRRCQWARFATIAVAILGVAFLGVGLLNGALQERLLYVVAYLLRLPVNALVISYLQKPEVALAFSRREG